MKTNYFASAFLAAILASCSNDDDFVPRDNIKNTPITVTAAVAELNTRAGYDENNRPAAFYLNVDNPSDDDYDYSSMMKYEGDEWVGYIADGTKKRTMVWDAAKTKVTATAATFLLDGAQDLAVQTDQSAADAVNVKSSDYLYMAATEVDPSVTDGKLPVTLSHIMSKIRLTITFGDEISSTDNPISDVVFKGTVASRNFNAGTWTDIIGVTAADIIPWADTYAQSKAQYEAVFVPQTIAAGEFAVTFNIGERTFKWTSASAVTLESGYEYTLELSAGKDKIGEVYFSASAWADGNGESGNIEIETE